MISVLGCSTLPGDKFIRHHFPKTKAFVDTEPTEPYKVLGVVRARANFNTADPNRDERMLCENYYNKAVKELVRRAKNEAGGDAVMRVRSVVFYMDGKTDLFPRPECSDDGAEGQVLVQGEAIRYTPK
ncbi:MAG: hypothetical protein EOP09_14375, partial [Proteobacteria bacterium]